MPINTEKIPYNNLTNMHFINYKAIPSKELEDAYERQQFEFQTKLTQISKYQKQLNHFSHQRQEFNTQFQNLNHLQYLTKKLTLKNYYEQCLYHIFNDSFTNTIDSIIFENLDDLKNICDHQLQTQIQTWLESHLTAQALDQVLQGVVNMQSWNYYDFPDVINLNANQLANINKTDPKKTNDDDIQATIAWLSELKKLLETIEQRFDQTYQMLIEPKLTNILIQPDLTLSQTAS